MHLFVESAVVDAVATGLCRPRQEFYISFQLRAEHFRFTTIPEARSTMPAKKSSPRKLPATNSAAGKSAKKNASTPGARAAAKSASKSATKIPGNPAKTSGGAVKKKAPQSMPYEEGKWAAVYSPRAKGERRYWLIKSEPDVFSYDDLVASPKRTTSWDSVRNTGARNFLRDGMKVGDLVFYYHSNAEPSAIVGICEVVREGYPDHTAFDPAHAYYDADSVRETPTWFMVDVRAVSKFARSVTLPEIKAHPVLKEMSLIKVSRLSVVPVAVHEWELVERLGRG
jgi:predicted RNA-binding protein with PUA-like domain